MSSINFALRLSQRLSPRPSARSIQRSSRLLRTMLLWSLLLHGLLALLILISVEWTPPPEQQSPPSIAMVFESGATKPSVPANPDSGHDVRTSPPAPPGAAPAPPTATSPPAPQALTMPQALPARPAPAPTPPVAAVPAPPQNAPQVIPATPAPPPSPSQSAGLVPLPMPPPPLAPPRVVPPPAPRPTLPRPRPPAEPQRERRPASPFSAPMEFSFGNTVPRRSPSDNRPAFLGPSASEGQTRASTDISDSIRVIGPGQPGEDWFGALHAWVQAHAYYPREAAENGEAGVAAVHLVINRSGHVDAVELVKRSGSQWLDLGIQGLFRGEHVPPFPPDTPLPDVELVFTIYYILRQR